MILTKHAAHRANERLPGRDVAKLYEEARLATGRDIELRIRKGAPTSVKQYRDRGWKGRYWLITQCGVVFAMAQGEVVLTVFCVSPEQSEKPASAHNDELPDDAGKTK